MLYPRIIPVLLIHNKGLVKTTLFKDPKYVGDPINAVRIFNEKEADELIVLDIDASTQGTDPDYSTIEKLASECRMPFCYGGGIKTVEQAIRILSLGVEKVAFSSAAFETPGIITSLSEKVGRQSVVVVLDIKKKLLSSKYECVIHNGKKRTKCDPLEMAQTAEALGAGELVINSVDADGTMKGYDIPIIEKIKSVVAIPVTAIGGAGSHDHLKALLARTKLIGLGAGSLFVFKGKYRAVLINYPTKLEKEQIFSI